MDPLWKDFDFCIACTITHFGFEKRRPSFFHWMYQTFGASGTLFTEEILCVGISLVNKVPDLYFHIEICVEQLDYRLLPAFQFRNAIFITVNWWFYSGQNGIHYGHILTVRSTYFTPCIDLYYIYQLRSRYSWSCSLYLNVQYWVLVFFAFINYFIPSLYLFLS